MWQNTKLVFRPRLLPHSITLERGKFHSNYFFNLIMKIHIPAKFPVKDNKLFN